MDIEKSRGRWPPWQHRKSLHKHQHCTQSIRIEILHHAAHVDRTWHDQEGSSNGVTTMPFLPQSPPWPAPPPHLVGEALALHVRHVGDDGRLVQLSQHTPALPQRKGSLLHSTRR
jgi:hypothetical protein